MTAHLSSILLNALVDGELSVEQAAAVKLHLDECPSCTASALNQALLKNAAARAGQRMYDKGGNAIDAAVASGFALNLLKPHLNGLGGEVPILIHSAADKKVYSLSGQGWAAKAATVDAFRKLEIKIIPGDGFLPACVPAAFGTFSALIRNVSLPVR